MRYFKSQFPNTPDYVIKDFIYKHYKNSPDQIEPEMVEWLQSLTWEKKTITVTLEIFDPFTQSRLKELMGGEATGDRHRTQQDRVQAGQAVAKEPIILTQDDGHLELQEGWHRTTAMLKKYPEGYQQVAWIGS